MARLFDNIIFMGNGEHSKKECFILKTRLELALITNCGLQQMHNNTDESVKGTREVEDTVRDIAMALLGKEIIIN